MATEGESLNQAEDGGGFNFEEWTKKLRLPRKVTQILRNEELVSREALALVETRDLKELGLPLGSIKLIIEDMKTSSDAKGADSAHEDNSITLAEAGKSLDILFSENKSGDCAQSANPKNGHMDPRTILTMKATSRKAVHITQFLTEKCKRRRQNRRREFVLRAGQSAETLVLKTDEEHPYLGIHLDEWGAANMRLMNYLLSNGDLIRQDIEYYLAYTTRIFEFADTYEWTSILNFDHSYRELQAEHGFQWGTFSPHMELQLLVPKRTKQVGESSPRQVGQTTEDCRSSKQRERALSAQTVDTGTLNNSRKRRRLHQHRRVASTRTTPDILQQL